jgi:restriction endonuclease Mrr
MAVPDYETLMLPVLRAVASGAPMTASEVRAAVAEQVGISEEDRAERLPSGGLLFDSRVHWAVTYMVQAGLLVRPKRAVVQITQRGQEVLHSNPDRVDNQVLEQFAEFVEFKSRTAQAPAAARTTPPNWQPPGHRHRRVNGSQKPSGKPTPPSLKSCSSASGSGSRTSWRRSCWSC